ncbi:hypothetical protein [Methylobacterium nonmethylotrophicum]|uniref:Uncharacterized protein n=1 Tax=Methylobacterium nonmethylotrophicum TaxID=1141884 RepID=A0A4Z0NZ00_9HYPH|nr:hypothetical protein [Methylobacterium nonmethylotrophicum]TGE01946.1 hypothetical protein EU555_04570 [Methylobacterium nonmethylotrophicum]
MALMLTSVTFSNPFKLRRPKNIEIFIQIILVVLLLALIFEFFEAHSSFDCRDVYRPVGNDCYPWGMTEGPLEGGSWNYSNKEIYLKSHIILIVSVAVAISAPFLLRSLWHTLSAMALIVLFDTYAAEWVAGLF